MDISATTPPMSISSGWDDPIDGERFATALPSNRSQPDVGVIW